MEENGSYNSFNEVELKSCPVMIHSRAVWLKRTKFLLIKRRLERCAAKIKKTEKTIFQRRVRWCVRLSKFEHSYQQVADSVKPDLLTASDSQRKVRLKIHLSD